jgi:hypothetical protein
MGLSRFETPVPLPMQSDDDAGQERSRCGGHPTEDRAEDLVGVVPGENHKEKGSSLQEGKPPWRQRERSEQRTAQFFHRLE